ncbi:MAG TPA: protein kinase [Kofleriaceae bacterium]
MADPELAEEGVEFADHLLGETLAARYQIEERLGEGAMGSVYRARHVKVGRPFAVKVLHRRLLEDAKVAQRFEREAELAGRLRHPNVVGVVDVGETHDGLRYMVMDFAEGPDLATLLSEAPMPAPRVVHLARQMLEGLYHAHEQGLIHRDFKPENVIVERDSHDRELPRIVDFGIAILREGGGGPSSHGRLTTNGLVLGTPHYMAPEQAVADPIDHRIDLFALGIVIYEMLSGKLPFDGTGAEVARANLLLDPPAISVRVPHLEVDPLLEAFARKLMAKKRDHRPATAKAARDILDLIERDRSAAATALGVTLPSAQRGPAPTAQTTPQRPERSTADFEAQIAAEEARGGMQVAPPTAPAMERAPMRPASQPSVDAAPTMDQAPLRPMTSITGALEAARPRHRRVAWIAAGVGAAVLATIIAVAAKGKHEPPAIVTPAVAENLPTLPPPAPKVEPKIETPASPPAPTGSAADTTDTAGSAATPPPTPPPVVVHKHARPPKPPVLEVTTTPPKPPAPALPAADAKVTSRELGVEYTTVGQQLAALRAKIGDDASELWGEYSRINISREFGSQQAIDATHATLSSIRARAAALAKQKK